MTSAALELSTSGFIYRQLPLLGVILWIIVCLGRYSLDYHASLLHVYQLLVITDHEQNGFGNAAASEAGRFNSRCAS